VFAMSAPMAANGTDKTRPSVQFAEENETREFSDDYELIFSEIWFASAEYVGIKARSREESKEWRRLGYGVLLQDTFERPHDNTQEYLNAFCQLEGDLSRRGLERQLSRRHGDERYELKERSRDSVLVHQMRLKKHGMKQEEITELLGHVYRDVTRPAKIFARRTAKADEYVAREGEDSQQASRLMEEHERRQKHPKLERRLSNFSSKSGASGNSFDSRRQWQSQSGTTGKTRCPSSPASALDAGGFYYADIA
jgi:hypothetical protein